MTEFRSSPAGVADPGAGDSISEFAPVVPDQPELASVARVQRTSAAVEPTPAATTAVSSALSIDIPVTQELDLSHRRLPPQTRGELPILPGGNQSWTYRGLKRLMDVVGACAALVLLSPVLLSVLLILTVTTKGRPFFRQERLGHCGRPFRMYKFRTMVTNAEQIRHLIENQHRGPIFKNVRDPRITRIGRLLRSTSIDEMPQLINVLLGQMSLVGPRPPLASEVAQYEPWQRRRLAVKPGLTCLWQVSGRSEISFDDWMLLDLWYVERQSLKTDLVLLLRTPWAVLSRRGAY